MLREVRIRQFRGFEKLEVKLAPSSVIVGPNSSGKTTLLHAIRIALRALDEANRAGVSRLHPTSGMADAGWIEVARDVLINNHTHYLPVPNREALFYRQIVGDNVSFAIHLIFDESDQIQELIARVWSARNLQLKLDVEVLAPDLAHQIRSLPKRGGKTNNLITEFVQQHAARSVMVPSFYGVVMDEEYRTGVIVDRLLGSGDQSHIVRNLVSRLSDEPFNRLNAFLRDTLNATIVRRTASQEADNTFPLRVFYRDDDGELELATAGAGLVNLIALYASLERYRGEQRQRPVIFLLDEPEAHLHPRLQGDMAAKIASAIVRDFRAQVIMATHAVEIVNRLADREDTTLIRVDRTASGATSLRGQSEIVNEISQWADLTPFSMVNFLAARRVLFYEGETDKDILEICARLRYRTDPVGLDRFRAWALAPMSGSGNAHVSRLLARLIESKAVPNLTGQTIRLITLLDRDYKRDPGRFDEGETAVGGKNEKTLIRAIRFVWQRHSIESLFLTPEVLEPWVRVWFGATIAPTDLRDIVAQAVVRANADQTLNDTARTDLTVKMVHAGMEKDGKRLGGENLIGEALKQAGEMIRLQPEVWQRGHDRERVVLGAIRERLPTPQRNRFRTDVHGLLATTPLDQFGDTESPIPIEIRELFDLMTKEP